MLRTSPLSLQHDLETRCNVLAGCEKVTWNITQGLPGVQGARFRLNIGFSSDSGALVGLAGVNRCSTVLILAALY